MITANIIKIHTEHAYVQNPVLKCICPSLLFSILTQSVCNKYIPSFYMNHFVLETEQGEFIGVNDGYMTIGCKMQSMSDSKIFECKPIKITIPVTYLKEK